jgi:hypothetical protein
MIHLFEQEWYSAYFILAVIAFSPINLNLNSWFSDAFAPSHGCKERGRIHFISYLKFGVFVTLRAPNVIILN